MDVNEKRFALFAACGVAGLAIIGGVNLFQARTAAPRADAISYFRFLDDLDRSEVRSVTLSGPRILGSPADGHVFRTYAADDPDLIRGLRREASRSPPNRRPPLRRPGSA